jgi:hypothetical protein
MSTRYVSLNGVAHVTLALMVTATLVRRVRLENMLALMATTALSGVCILGTREPSCTTESATHFFILDARDQQRLTRHVAALEPPQ